MIANNIVTDLLGVSLADYLPESLHWLTNTVAGVPMWLAALAYLIGLFLLAVVLS